MRAVIESSRKSKNLVSALTTRFGLFGEEKVEGER